MFEGYERGVAPGAAIAFWTRKANDRWPGFDEVATEWLRRNRFDGLSLGALIDEKPEIIDANGRLPDGCSLTDGVYAQLHFESVEDEGRFPKDGFVVNSCVADMLIDPLSEWMFALGPNELVGRTIVAKPNKDATRFMFSF